MKKKWLIITVILALVTGFFLAGCDNSNDPSNNPTPGPGPGPGEPPDTGTPYNIVVYNGVLNKEDTTILQFYFDVTQARGAIAIGDITFTDGTGQAEPVKLTDANGPMRNVDIKVIKQGTINVKITKEGFSSAVRTVEVFKRQGIQPDSTVGVKDIIKIGNPTLTSATGVTFGRFDGDPIAILPPRTREPITTIGATSANWAFEHVIAQFDPPLDLRDSATQELRWLTMVWEGFKEDGKYDFETPSTVASAQHGDYTGTRFDLHNVQFQLDLTTSTDARIRWQQTSEINTTSGLKQPVQFLKGSALTTTGNTAWGTGHQIKTVTLRITGMQLRSPLNQHWPTISAARNPILEDTYILSLVADTNVPPAPLVLFENGEWSEMVKNPRWAQGDAVFNIAETTDATDPTGLTGRNGTPTRLIWDPINVSREEGQIQYSTLVITQNYSSWVGYGLLTIKESSASKPSFTSDDYEILMNWTGLQSATWRMTLSPSNYQGEPPPPFNAKAFAGFFFQPGADATVNITKISLE